MWQAPRTADLVDRQLTATQPNQLWVSDFSVAYQERLKAHLAEFKRRHLGIREPGVFRYRGRYVLCEHILPRALSD